MGARLEITGTVPRGSGLSSSAALEVALCLALLAVADVAPPGRLDLARLCSRVENEWVGAQTGLLDQIASLFGEPERAMRIDFQSLEVTPVALELDGYRLVTLDSGERHANAGGDDATADGYNQRRAECVRAAELLGVESLRDATLERVAELPEPLRARAHHVVTENARVQDTVAALSNRRPRARRRAAQRLSRQPARLLCHLDPDRGADRDRRWSTPAPSGRGSWAAASAATCWA